MVSFLVDENCMDFMPMLVSHGFDAFTPKDLGLHYDSEIVECAFYKRMVLITRDNGCAKLCRKHSVDCIHISSDHVFSKIILPYALTVEQTKNGKKKNKH